jgi:uncharacterized protein (TIGR00251 family)
VREPRIRETGDGALLELRVSPGSKSDAITGVLDDRLKVSVRTAPEKGKANRAVCKLLAGALRCRATDLEILRGLGSRSKTLLVRGLGESELRDRVRALLLPLEESR